MADITTLRREYFAAKAKYLATGERLGRAERLHKTRTPEQNVRTRWAALRQSPSGFTAAKREVKEVQSKPRADRRGVRARLTAGGRGSSALDKWIKSERKKRTAHKRTR